MQSVNSKTSLRDQLSSASDLQAITAISQDNDLKIDPGKATGHLFTNRLNLTRKALMASHSARTTKTIRRLPRTIQSTH